MNKLLSGATLAVAATTTVLAMAQSTTSSAQEPGGRTVHLFESERGGTFGFVDNPPHSPASNPESPKARFSPGDQGLWTGVILDRRGGKRLGRVYGTETVMRGKRFPHVTNIVHVVFALRDGQIIVEQALDESRSGVPAAVIGGTGAYAGARGTFLAKPGKGGNSYTISLQN
jgi:hypothetical protein